MGSPTIMQSLALDMAPTAIPVRICDASSKITISNFGKSRLMYCATDKGLMSIHGSSRGKTSALSLNISRIDTPLPLLCIIRERSAICRASLSVPVRILGICATSAALICSRLKSSISFIKRLYSSSFRSSTM